MIQLTLTHDRTDYSPGDEISGTVRWQFSQPPPRIDLNLCWSSRGKGSEDFGVAATQGITDPGMQGERSFSFKAPTEPYSFSGKLISLVWSLEAVTPSGEDDDATDLVIAPEGREISLPRLEADPLAQLKGGSFWQKLFQKKP